VVEPGSMYGNRWNEVDLRITKTFRPVGSKQLQVMADLYNALNANPGRHAEQHLRSELAACTNNPAGEVPEDRRAIQVLMGENA
jgi:hypothetical protein